MKHRLALIALVVVIGTAGCGSDSSGSGGLDRAYSANIVRTTYGIPHITGSDFGNLGYGLGYAYAQDNFCVLMREIVIANGEAARYWGEEFANSDFVYSWANSDEFIENEFIVEMSEEAQALGKGYAAGMNLYLDETGVDNLAEGPEGCRGEEWVRPIDQTDVAKRLHKLILLAGLDSDEIGAIDRIMDGSAAAPTQSTASAFPVGPQSVQLASHYTDDLPVDRMGSNAYGIGAEGSQTDYGILLGNPHFPWQGPQRFYVSHLTVPGEYDVMGGSLHGVPLILIGFNKDVAWSHTVSTAQRFTFFELELLPDDPYKYRYDDEVRDIEAVPYTIEVKLEDGTIEERTENIYFSHLGPIMDLGALVGLVGGWPTTAGTVFAFADANLTNTRILQQFLEMGQSTSIDDLENALKAVGIPWVNTIAADRHGTGYYADISTVPHVTQEQLIDCAEGLSSLITDFGIASLNGSRSECEWGSDPDGPEGLFGFSNLPTLRTSEEVPYVANANDSYWLSSPNGLLEGYSPLMGRNGKEPPEGIAQGDRTRQAFIMGDERLAGTDGLSETGGFTVELLQQVHQSSRNLPGELVRADVVTLCKQVAEWNTGDCDSTTDGDQPYSANPEEAAQACDILEAWDGRFNNESVGAAVWREFWNRAGSTGFWRQVVSSVASASDLWAVPFDPDDPVGTPNTLDDGDPRAVEVTRCAVGGAVDFLIAGGIPLERPWGQVQFRWNADGTEQIPIHGGSDMFNNISAGFVQDEGYSNIVHGNSYVQTVTWTESECPDAYAVLTYSQSTDPASDHYDDQTRIWSNKVWNDMPFCPTDIEAQKISEIDLASP
jgi:acyl-homoserine-lactone acylase